MAPPGRHGVSQQEQSSPGQRGADKYVLYQRPVRSAQFRTAFRLHAKETDPAKMAKLKEARFGRSAPIPPPACSAGCTAADQAGQEAVTGLRHVDKLLRADKGRHGWSYDMGEA